MTRFGIYSTKYRPKWAGKGLPVKLLYIPLTMGPESREYLISLELILKEHRNLLIPSMKHIRALEEQIERLNRKQKRRGGYVIGADIIDISNVNKIRLRRLTLKFKVARRTLLKKRRSE